LEKDVYRAIDEVRRDCELRIKRKLLDAEKEGNKRQKKKPKTTGKLEKYVSELFQ